MGKLDGQRMERDFSVGMAWLRENGRDFVMDHPEAVIAILFVLFVLSSCN